MDAERPQPASTPQIIIPVVKKEEEETILTYSVFFKFQFRLVDYINSQTLSASNIILTVTVVLLLLSVVSVFTGKSSRY